MTISSRILAGNMLVGLGVLAAVVIAPSYELFAAGLIVLGLVLAVRALMTREREFERQRAKNQGASRVADWAMVAASAGAGWLAAGGNEVAWFGAAAFFAILIWWCRPGMMSSG